MRSNVKDSLLRCWYQPRGLFAYMLSPLSALYRVIIALRRAYLQRVSVKFNIPVIIAGNITLGGTGKTPFVIWLSRLLKSNGYKPGIISRGYLGHSPIYPLAVTPDSDPDQTGDEAVLLALHTACPVVIDPDRVRAATFLLQHYECNIIISDDGLQHYKLARDIEIILIDSARGFGNGCCLPAGPLREPLARLKEADFVVSTLQLIPDKLYNLISPELTQTPDYFLGEPVHAVAGIGNPEQFFSLLRALGLSILPHAFPDHHAFTETDFNFALNSDIKIIMTEKDAVKCRRFADYRYWCLPVSAQLDAQFSSALLQCLEKFK